MKNNKTVLVITHVIYRNNAPFDKLEGPYSSVEKSCYKMFSDVEVCQIPIGDFNNPVVHGPFNKNKLLKIAPFAGKFLPLKYLLDAVIVIFISFGFIIRHRGKEKYIIAIDPLTCLPLAILRFLLGSKLIYYCVDFNLHRFDNKMLQWIYEKADKISTRRSDQTWVVCESLLDYKLNKFKVKSIYIPNSTTFNPTLYNKNLKFKKGNKIAWTGTLLTDRQFDILFRVLNEIQQIKKDCQFVLAPINNYDKFAKYAEKYKIKQIKILSLHSRAEWQEYAVKCDVGIAIYDEKFGSTEFIEPLKIWDFLLCGMPFIISGEPSISTPIQKAGVVYRLNKGNKIPKDDSLKQFLSEENIKKNRPKCIDLAKEFNILVQINQALKKIN